MAFRGTFDFTLDAKNRLTVPAKFRAALADGIVLARGAGRCLELWPQAEYEAQQAAHWRGTTRCPRSTGSSSAVSSARPSTPSSTAPGA